MVRIDLAIEGIRFIKAQLYSVLNMRAFCHATLLRQDVPLTVPSYELAPILSCEGQPIWFR